MQFCPLTSQLNKNTEKSFGAKQFAQMKKGSVLVNTARYVASSPSHPTRSSARSIADIDPSLSSLFI